MSLYGANSNLSRNNGELIRRRDVRIDPGKISTLMSVPAFTGNLAAANISGTSSLTKALLSILAGMWGGTKIADLSKELAFTNLPGAPALWLGTTLSGGVGIAYTARRILDSFKRRDADNRDR